MHRAPVDMHTRLTASLKKYVAECRTRGNVALPSARPLARLLGQPLRAVLAALAELRAAGLIDYRKGSRIRIVSAAPTPIPPPRPTAAQRLYDQLRSQISRGELEVGEPLPKAAFIAATQHVSCTTVRTAFARLMDEGLASKRGKRILVGPLPDAAHSEATQALGDTILVVQSADGIWQRYGQSEFVSPFVQSFAGAARRARCGLMSYVTGRSATGLSGDDHRRLWRILRRTSPRCRGVLLVGLQPRDPAFEPLVHLFGEAPQRCVWLNVDNTPRKTDGSLRGFVECRFAERRAAREALRMLQARGHRRIGFPFQQSIAWMHQRARILMETAAEISPELQVVPVSNRTPFWSGDETPAQRVRRLSEHGVPHIRRHLRQTLRAHPGLLDSSVMQHSDFYRWYGGPLDRGERALLWSTPLLAPLLSEHRVTALVAPCDHFARYYATWLSLAGIEVPADVSLVSFNNYVEYSLQPITSIDLGMDTMGYAALHVMLGDIAVGTPGNRIEGEICTVERGSVGPVDGSRSFRFSGSLR